MKSREPPSSALQQTLDKTADFQRRASLQLSAYLVVFIFFSTFGLANRLASLANGGAPTPDWLVMAQAITMPLQGFANGIVFFRWVRENWSFPCLGGSIREIASLEEVSVADPAPTFDMLNVSGRDSPSIVAQPTAAGRQPQPRRHEFTARVFAATWNLGEAELPDGVVPLLAEWLPEGRDVYLIGMQECLQPQQWQRAIAAALDLHGSSRPASSRKYGLVAERMIGSDKTSLGYHGFIVLLAFVAADVTAAGTFSEVKSGSASVARGASIAGVARAANKGAVGAAFRFHAHTFAVVSCHLAADKKGKRSTSKRLADTRKLLEGLDWRLIVQKAISNALIITLS